MNKVEFDEMLNTILDYGVEITLSKEKESGIFWYDMNTSMKSAFPVHVMTIREKLKNYSHLLDEINDCMCGRDFGSSTWLEIIKNR